tara:strand:- start:1207 stop:1398 length:192 start_codon:yes stop_codon:yes gene_type:complete
MKSTRADNNINGLSIRAVTLMRQMRPLLFGLIYQQIAASDRNNNFNLKKRYMPVAPKQPRVLI